MAGMNEARGTILFAAELRPHSSLSPPGFWLLMAAVSAASFATGFGFWRLGAWPVGGFLGLDVALVYIAFRVSFRRGREVETLRLSAEALAIERIRPNGAVTRWRLQPYWLRVRLGQQDVAVRSHGREVAVGRFLNPAEREALAAALAAALARWRAAQIAPRPSTSDMV